MAAGQGPAELSALESALCGGAAGIASRIVIAPLDVVKIRLQVRRWRTHPTPVSTKLTA